MQRTLRDSLVAASRRRARAGLLALVAALVFPSALHAQIDIIRGRVTAATVDNAPILGVVVTATSISGNVSRTATTNSDGRYSIAFPGGDGDYWVSFAAIGYAARRFEVKRLADEAFLIADARLAATNITLDTIFSRAQGNRRRPSRSDTTSDVSGTDRSINPNLVPPDQAGDLAAMAATLPGVTYIPGTEGDPSGFSVLGLSTDQNLTNLNGLSSSASDLPRDAGISVSVSSSPYDVSQGGFSGGALNVRTQSGSNYFVRNLSFVGNAPQLEWTDPAGRALGQEYTNGSFGGIMSGPLAYNAAFYNVSWQLGRRANDLFSLLNSDPLGLETQGVAADSVTRLLNILGNEGVPATVAGFPGSRLSDQGSLLGSFDFAPPSSLSGQALNLTANAGWSRSAPASLLTRQLPAASFRSTNWNGSARLRHTTYFSFGILSETGLAVTQSRRYTTPYLTLPGGNVLIHSDFADGTSGVQSIQFGGTSANSTNSSNSVDFTNQLSWFSSDNKHRLKLTSEIRRDGWSLEQANNQLGTFTFNSLADLENGQPAAFTRQLTPFQTSGSEMIGAMSLGDSYRVTPDLQLVYGARVDANWFLDHPDANPDLLATFSRSNDHVPNGVYVSPRIGFSWTYGTAPQIGAFFGAARVPRGIIRGGIGVFQNALGAQLPANAMANTGLASGVQQVTCVGAAAPVPDWTTYGADQSAIPAECTNGTLGTPFVSAAPNATIFAPNYAAQRSIRSNLQWSRPMLDNRIMTTLSGTYSLNENQTGFADLNFDPTVRFTLPDEAGRPVFVAPTSIVPATGAVAVQDSRVSNRYNRVTELRSDYSSTSRQLGLQINPLSLNSHFTWGLGYTLNSITDQASGFSSTVGNPFDVVESRSSADWRHQIQANVGLNLLDLFRINWFQRFQSGTPFTPMVGSDINGDGYANDRAFIANPAATSDAALASGMTTLLANASPAVRRCLESQLGQLAARNSCEGPWTTQGFFTISFNPVKIRLPQRTSISLQIANPLGAADLLLHGEGNLHGWGQTPLPDPRLLVVRGYDAVAQRYVYDVNQRFGSTSQAVSTIRNPVAVTLSFRLDIGPPRERQYLTQTLDRGRKTPGTKGSASLFKAMYASSGGIINPMATILTQADSLHLTGPQADSLATMNRWYVIHADSLWSPVANYFAALPDHYDQGDAYARFREAREASVDLLITLVPSITGLLTPTQQRQLPDLIKAYLDLRYLAAVRSGTSGSPGGVFAPGSSGPTFGGVPIFIGR